MPRPSILRPAAPLLERPQRCALAAAVALALAPTLAFAAGHASDEVTAPVVGADGAEIGSVTLQQTPSGAVLIKARIEGIEPGEHGFHIHETGKCEAADGFKSAGGHYAGEGDPKHGLVEGGSHAGDMANAHVGEDGVLEISVMNDRVSLGSEGTNPLADADGSALMVHSGPDDYVSQPSGAAGDRVACAVIHPPAS